MSSETGGNLRGVLLFSLRPAGVRGLFSDLTPTTVGQRDEAPLAADPATLPAHFGHDLRDDRLAWRGCVLYGGQNDAPGILHVIELRCASSLRHEAWSQGPPHAVKLKKYFRIPNRPTTRRGGKLTPAPRS